MATAYAPPKNDAYTVLLSISLGALVIGCILLFMDWNDYSGTSGKKPPTPPQPAVSVGADQGAAPIGGQPVTPAPAPAPAPAGGQSPPQDNK